VRVISGSARGRKLKEPAGHGIRRTSDMVKESIFNIIQFDIEGRRVLDLFAGTGQMGIEALSRGAKGVTFVDSSPEAVKLIRENLKLCGFDDRATVHTRDALRHLGRNQPGDQDRETYDLIFVDPPYGTELASAAVEGIIRFDKLNANGIIICETKANYVMKAVSLPYSLQKEYRYGSVKIMRYTREN